MGIMGLFSAAVKTIAPIFIMTSPVTSYADQIYSIHRTGSSAGFSLDIPLIMLVASILKIYYWLGAHYALSLLTQSLLMIAMQLLLLYVALINRPSYRAPTLPLSDLKPALKPQETTTSIFAFPRPYNFWRWHPTRPYWTFLTYFTLSLALLHLLFSASEYFRSYTNLLGYIALAIEATLPLPQILANQSRRCCKGFRVSVLANWLIGDVFKMCFFFLSGDSEVPWAFKLCGLFQFACDLYLGVQYFMFGDGEEVAAGLAEKGTAMNGRMTPGRGMPGEREVPLTMPIEGWENTKERVG